MTVKRTEIERRPDPERLRMTLAELDEPEETEDATGWVYGANAQSYNTVNDRLMLFRPGSGKKTIAERVPKGRVKIHDGHPWDPNSDTIVGRVLSAEETNLGVRYQGFLSASEETLVQKIRERTIDENSLELHVLLETPAEVEIAAVPEHVRKWVHLSSSGKAVVRGIDEWMWTAIGLVSRSSQGSPAILEDPRVVTFQDLPVVTSGAPAWDPDAVHARLSAWSVGGRPVPQAFLGYPGSPLGVPIADVLDDQLVVTPEALRHALEALRSIEDPTLLATAARHLGRYEEKLRLTVAQKSCHPAGESDALSDAAGPELPPTDGSDRTLALLDAESMTRETELLALRSEVELL